MGTGIVKVPVPGISDFFWCYRNRYRKNLVPKKVSESVSKKFDTGKKSRNRYWKFFVPELLNFRRQNFEILKIYNGYRYRIGTGNLLFFLVVSEKFWYRKSPGIGLGKFWYRKKYRNRSRKILVPKKVSESVLFRFWVSSHTAWHHNCQLFCSSRLVLSQIYLLNWEHELGGWSLISVLLTLNVVGYKWGFISDTTWY